MRTIVNFSRFRFVGYNLRRYESCNILGNVSPLMGCDSQFPKSHPNRGDLGRITTRSAKKCPQGIFFCLIYGNSRFFKSQENPWRVTPRSIKNGPQVIPSCAFIKQEKNPRTHFWGRFVVILRRPPPNGPRYGKFTIAIY